MFFFFSLEFFLSKIIRNNTYNSRILLHVLSRRYIIKEERKEERGDFKKKKKRRRRRRAFTTRSSLFHTTKVFVIKRYIQLVGVVGKRLDYAIFTGRKPGPDGVSLIEQVKAHVFLFFFDRGSRGSRRRVAAATATAATAGVSITHIGNTMVT